MRRTRQQEDLDAELAHLLPEQRWREWMARVEAAIFAAPEPLGRDALAHLVGRECNLDLILDDIGAALHDRPYELVVVAGGWQLRTRRRHAQAVRIATGLGDRDMSLSRIEELVLTAVAYYQPITRAELSRFFGKEVGRDLIARLRALELIGSGPRSPQPGAPYTLVTTRQFLALFGFATLRDLPDMEMLEDAGLLAKDKLLAGEIPLAPLSNEERDDD